MIRILHILPALDIGGVEIGVKMSLPYLSEKFDYRLFSIKGPGQTGLPTLTPRELASQLRDRHSRPHVVVSSLWPSHPIGWSLQALGIRWLPFFHAAAREGGHRDLVLAWAAKHSRLRLCDSVATATYFGFTDNDAIVCPYLFDQRALKPQSKRTYTIIVCGRLAPQKRPDLILLFLEMMQKRWPAARSLLLITGDEAAFSTFAAEASARLSHATILHNVPSEDVAGHMQSADFYLNLSDYEGFSMTTVEALRSGCVPVVRPVGEIPNYLPRQAGIFIDHPDAAGFEAAIETCRRLSGDATQRAAMVSVGCERLNGYEDYVSAFSRAVDRAMAVP